MGFLSRRMRDAHPDSGHQEAKSQAKLSFSNLDLDEIEPLLFGLIGLDKIEAVKSNVSHFITLRERIRGGP